MRIRFEGDSYEMTMFRATLFHVQHAWFPIRRFLRAVKRAAKSLASWGSTLLLFIPIFVGVLSGLVWWQLIKLPEAISEFCLLLLGSFLLLAIKEVRDREIRRHSILKKQWSFYSEWYQELLVSLLRLARCMGIDIQGRHDFLDSGDNVDVVIGSATSFEPDISDCLELLNRIYLIVSTIPSIAREFEFVDWDAFDGSGYLFQHIQSQMESFPPLEDVDFEQKISWFRDFALSILHLLALVRRPWRYRNDVARRELLLRYVRKYGVLYE